jgi:uncharacterized protein YgbK (DUF1537 family)
MSLALVADDLTGACDAGAPFAGRGPVAVYTDAGAVDASRPVVALDTGTRGLPAAGAAARVARAVATLAGLRGGRLFKKIDSTLRGHAGAELGALLAATGRPGAVAAPAFPAQGRTVVGGLVRVDGVPVHETAIGLDPSFAGGNSCAAALLARGAGRPVALLALAVVRSGAAGIRAAAAGGAIVAAEAETDADLDAIAAALVAAPDLIAAGSAGLARALADRLGLGGPPPPLPDGRAWLVVAGSRHPATRAQVAALCEAGAAALAVTPGRAADVAPVVAALRHGRAAVVAAAEAGPDDPAARSAMAGALAAAVRAVLGAARPDLLVVTGGDTARALLDALHGRRLEVAGAPRPGLALADPVLDGGPAPTWLTKAGGFGLPGLLCDLVKGHA